MEDKLIGCFSDYLSKYCINIRTYNTHDNYISAIYVQMIEKFPSKKNDFSRYYSTLRQNIFDNYQKKNVEMGIIC